MVALSCLIILLVGRDVKLLHGGGPTHPKSEIANPEQGYGDDNPAQKGLNAGERAQKRSASVGSDQAAAGGVREAAAGGQEDEQSNEAEQDPVREVEVCGKGVQAEDVPLDRLIFKFCVNPQ